jgi:hypothetical protein
LSFFLCKTASFLSCFLVCSSSSVLVTPPSRYQQLLWEIENSSCGIYFPVRAIFKCKSRSVGKRLSILACWALNSSLLAIPHSLCARVSTAAATANSLQRHHARRGLQRPETAGDARRGPGPGRAGCKIQIAAEQVDVAQVATHP